MCQTGLCQAGSQRELCWLKLCISVSPNLYFVCHLFSVSANLFFRIHHLLSVSPNLSVMCHPLKISVSCAPSCETLLFEQTRESGAQSQVGALNIRLQKSLRNLTILLWTVWTNFYHNADQPCSFCRDESLKAHDYPLGWHGHGFLF